MKDAVPEKLENCRIRTGFASSKPEWGFVGAFIVPGVSFGMNFGDVRLIIDDGTGGEYKDLRTGWEHVSVSVLRGSKTQTPSWDVMSKVKDLVWKPTERVVQYHPPEDEYVNYHPHVLHLWRPLDEEIPFPPPNLVGPKSHL